jgi:nitrogen fixation NifU-like protein
MPDLRELYQEMIIDHHKRPRNFHKLQQANRQAEGFNPLCGDKVSVYLRIEDGVVRDVGFVGAGCAISTASASMMTESLKGRTEAEVEALFKRFHDLVTGRLSPDADLSELGKLAGLQVETVLDVEREAANSGVARERGEFRCAGEREGG